MVDVLPRPCFLCHLSNTNSLSWSPTISAGLPWLGHLSSGLYKGKMFVSRLLGKCFLATKPGFCAANLLEVESLRVQSFVALLYPQGRSQTSVCHCE